jgi:hypothetical protein
MFDAPMIKHWLFLLIWLGVNLLGRVFSIPDINSVHALIIVSVGVFAYVGALMMKWHVKYVGYLMKHSPDEYDFRINAFMMVRQRSMIPHNNFMWYSDDDPQLIYLTMGLRKRVILAEICFLLLIPYVIFVLVRF